MKPAEVERRKEELLDEAATLEEFSQRQRDAKRRPTQIHREIAELVRRAEDEREATRRALQVAADDLTAARSEAILALTETRAALLKAQAIRREFDATRKRAMSLDVPDDPTISAVAIGPKERRQVVLAFQQAMREGIP
ncbi:MAG: hypothetical protein H0U46_09110 [Actinobacteria bacterium]|nr:hypothetical protein [Actinomycetota bacterium]